MMTTIRTPRQLTTDERKRFRRLIWLRACEHDGIDPEARFVIFSKDNHWAELLNDSRGYLSL